MADILTCEIVNPVKVLFSGEAGYVSLPGELGSFGVMRRHEPFVSALTSGKVLVSTEEDGKSHKVTFLVSGGFAQIDDDRIIVLADDAIAVDSIVADDVRAELEKTDKALAALAADDPASAYYKDQKAWLSLQLETVTEA